MIDNCTAWQHNDAISREILDLILAGYCTYGPEPCAGIWMNVPSKWGACGGMGSQEYVDAKTAERAAAA